MKKALVALSLLLTVGLTTVLANEETKIDPRILTAFQKEFSFAKNVRWEVGKEYTQANFSLNDQGFVAWYNTEGELLSVARNILYNQLPLSVIKALGDKYADANLSGIIEVTRDNESSYLMNAEKKGKKYLLKATSSGNVTVVKRIK
jgi:hypothetical protein